MSEDRDVPPFSGFPDEGIYPAELTAQYELVECFSETETSQTLLAAERVSGKLYVVKCYLRGHAFFDYEEPQSLRNLKMPPIPAFAAEYRNREMRCVLREYVSGETLAALAAFTDFSEEDVVNIGLQLCNQLQVLHAMNPPVIHRDIKPQNVVIRNDGTAVLIDYGIARVYTDTGSDTVAFGTQGFAPPEQYGFAETDARSDIYSLGILLFWLLHRETKVPRIGNTPLEKVIARCTAFDPNERFTDVSQMKRALLSTRPAGRRKRNFVLSAAAVLLLMLAALGISLGTGVRPTPISFSNSLVEQAVRLNLGLEENDVITEDMLGQVTGIYIVADTAYADMDSFYSAISRRYTEKDPTRGDLSDLSDLSRLETLQQICIAAQELKDISALGELKEINKVELKHNFIRDISVLAGMENLRSVGINDNPVRDLTPLAECPNLAFLDLCDVRGYDPSVMSLLGSFDFLDISNPTKSYLYLDGKNILDLRIAWTGLADLHALDHVTGLEKLEISHTKVTDLSPLTLHPGLRVLMIEGLSCTDLSVLRELPSLEEVYISTEMQNAIDALDEVSFAVHTA